MALIQAYVPAHALLEKGARVCPLQPTTRGARRKAPFPSIAVTACGAEVVGIVIVYEIVHKTPHGGTRTSQSAQKDFRSN